MFVFISTPSPSQFTTNSLLPYPLLTYPPLLKGNHLSLVSFASDLDAHPNPMLAKRTSYQYRKNLSLSVVDKPCLDVARELRLSHSIKHSLTLSLTQYATG